MKRARAASAYASGLSRLQLSTIRLLGNCAVVPTGRGLLVRYRTLQVGL